MLIKIEISCSYDFNDRFMLVITVVTAIAIVISLSSFFLILIFMLFFDKLQQRIKKKK